MLYQFHRPQALLSASFLTGFAFGGVLMCIPLYSKEWLHASGMMLGVCGLSFNVLLVVVALKSETIRQLIGFRAALSVGASLLAVSSIAMVWARTPYAAILPCLLWGVAHALYVSASLGATAEGQSPEQISRGTILLILASVVGQMAGSAILGVFYGLHPLLPFWVCGGFAALAAALPLLPGTMEIVPWRARAVFGNSKVAPEEKRSFVRMAFLANFAMSVSVLIIMMLLPEYTQRISISGSRYGSLIACQMVGIVMSYILLGSWHGWRYSRPVLFGAQILAAATLLWFSFTGVYWQLCLSLSLVGAVLGLTYLSSVYYGMEQGGWETGHAGRHEAVVGAAMGIGPLLGGAVIAVTNSPRAPFVIAAGLVLLFAVIQTIVLARARGDFLRTAGAVPAAGGFEPMQATSQCDPPIR